MSVNAVDIHNHSLHVAIIMDGNGRWANERNQMRAQGHHAGVLALRKTIKAAVELNISHLTVYAFSTENWRRPASEVSDLMGLLKAFIKSDLDKLHREGVRIRIIGSIEGLPKDIIQCVEDAQERTRSNSTFNLQVALNYGARADIIQAAKRCADLVSGGALGAEDITEKYFTSMLSTCDLPPLDLLIRTSGEYRLSNFLLWEAAYAELVFQDILWPDYNAQSLKEALDEYRSRDRRYGGLSQSAETSLKKSSQ